MKKVMVFGCFDVLHTGHIVFLEKAAAYGDELLVVIGRDKTIEKIKGRPPHINEEARRKMVDDLPFVARAVLGSTIDQYAALREYRPDIICLGHDQKTFTGRLQEFLEKNSIPTEIIRLPAYKRHLYSSTKIKKDLGIGLEKEQSSKSQ